MCLNRNSRPHALSSGFSQLTDLRPFFRGSPVPLGTDPACGDIAYFAFSYNHMAIHQDICQEREVLQASWGYTALLRVIRTPGDPKCMATNQAVVGVR